MKIEQNAYDRAVKAGMPPKPVREDFKSEQEFDETLNRWMLTHGRNLVMWNTRRTNHFHQFPQESRYEPQGKGSTRSAKRDLCEDGGIEA